MFLKCSGPLLFMSENKQGGQSSQYEPRAVEAKWSEVWETEHIYKFDQGSNKEIFSVDTPPPTVSGKMHIGHAFSFSQQDFIMRFQRMRGKNVFAPFGTDDNGLATERLVEKMNAVRSKSMDRQEFITLCLKTLESIRPQYIRDWKRIGMSCDFDIFYTTINEHCQRISQKAFLDLVKMGRAYRKFAPVIFCPHCQTSIAQVEMEDKEKSTTLNMIKAKMAGGTFILYATTRPELHPACVGISIDEEGDYCTVKRPDGEVWTISKDAFERMKEEFQLVLNDTFKGKDIIGKTVEIPLANPVRVSHDISAKTEYGTGVVYYCSYGGLDCVEWMARHKDAEPILIMDESGKYTHGPYKGMESEEARIKVLEDLEKSGNLLKKEHMKHVTNVHERCATPIEYVAMNQWFIRYLDLKDVFLERGNELQWYPPHMKNRFDNWVKGLQWDWCISRQRFYGVPFPVWYDKKTKEPIFADESLLPVDPLKDLPKGKSREDILPEQDVLDTWATSSLTPQIAIQLMPQSLQEKLFPMDLRPQAHDIISFWLFNTVVRSHLHHDSLPWEKVMISGWALDPHGKKMSKSRGNVVEPQVIIEKYSADALRFWAAGSKLGDDLPFQEKDVMTGQKFVKKLWNAAKFSFIHLESYKGERPEKLEVMDHWILSHLQRLIKACTETFEDYEYVRTRLDTDKFFWQMFCDNYLEIAKDRLYTEDEAGKDGKLSAQFTLHHVLLAILKLMAPITPFITEEIYQQYYAKKEGKASIHISSWPVSDPSLESKEAELAGGLFLDVLSAVRKWKSDQNLSMKKEVQKITISAPDEAKALLSLVLGDLMGVTNAKDIVFGAKAARETGNYQETKIKISVEQ